MNCSENMSKVHFLDNEMASSETLLSTYPKDSFSNKNEAKKSNFAFTKNVFRNIKTMEKT
jgi:hypothetical protein